MIKLAMIGAGSTVFMQNILTDILLEPCFNRCTVALQDIDPKRLQTSLLVAEKIVRATDTSPVIMATEDRREALRDADFVVLMIQVGGYRPATVIDFEIPLSHISHTLQWSSDSNPTF